MYVSARLHAEYPMRLQEANMHGMKRQEYCLKNVAYIQYVAKRYNKFHVQFYRAK